MTRRQADRGVALPLALLALVILGLLIGSTLWAAHVESRAGRHALEAVKARLAADLTWPDVFTGSDSLAVSVTPGDSVVLSSRAGAGSVTASAVLHRLGPELFLVESVGFAGRLLGNTGASYRVQILARLDSVRDTVTGRSIRRLRPLAAPFWSGLPRAY